MKVAFCIPTTSAGKDWKSIEDSYLFQFNSINTQHEITYFIGYDKGDPLFDDASNRSKFKAQWVECDFEKGHVTAIWNKLYEQALQEGIYDYFWLAGDDISYVEEDWLDALINSLDKTRGVGIAGVYNGNPNLPMTQFLVSPNHHKIFGFAYPDEIKNWYCDDWISEVYPTQLVHYHEEFHCLNSGGEPRYSPDKNDKEWQNLVARYRIVLNDSEVYQSLGMRAERYTPLSQNSEPGENVVSKIKKRLKSLLGVSD